ncbi:hypothetical protein SDC9_102805 [bioreactor metagenome]|uniref:Uncharacterized protein n=1 Tax=bioreactor metagenome TaxID=1076179 RepID=A0A645ASF4_9ZZZZ
MLAVGRQRGVVGLPVVVAVGGDDERVHHAAAGVAQFVVVRQQGTGHLARRGVLHLDGHLGLLLSSG